MLAVAAAAYPLFLSSSASRLLRSGIANPVVTPVGAGFTYRNGTLPVPTPGETRSVVERTGEAFAALIHDPKLGAIESSMLGPPIRVARADRPEITREVRLFSGTDATSNVPTVAGGSGSGVWLPDDVAGVLHIAPGDAIVVSAQTGERIRLSVAGVFRSLLRLTVVPGFWHPWFDDLGLDCPRCDYRPPQPLIVPSGRVGTISDGLGIRKAAFAWSAPVVADLTLEDARRIAGEGAALSREVFGGSSPASRLLDTCYGGGFCNSKNGPSFVNEMPQVLDGVNRRVTTIGGPGRLLRSAGVLVALVVIAGAGVFSMAARRVEASFLYARGLGPLSIAVRAGLESLAPCVLGAFIGLGISLGAVAWIGAAAVAGDARAAAIRGAVVAAVAATILIGAVSAVSFLRHVEHHRARLAFLATIPWEIAIAALSLWVLARLRSGGAFTVDPSTHLRGPSALLLLFPVLFLAGFGTIVARAFGFVLRWWRARSGRLSAPMFLAVHRLATARRLTLLLIGASALCLGLFVQSQVVVRSLRTTVDAKARVFVGSDLQVGIDYRNTVPDRFPMPFTRVTRRKQAGTMVPSGEDYDLLAIDPSTFASAAYWNPAFADTSLEDLVGRLGGRPEGSVPILMVGDAGADPTSLAIDQIQIPVHVVGRARAFPGVSSIHPLVVVDEAALVRSAAGAPNPLDEVGAETQLWVRGDPGRAAVLLARALPYQPGLELTARQVEDIPYIAAAIDSFEVMDWLGVAAALLVLVAMLMYLQARQRSQIVSYGLSLRMGMRPSAHRGALLAELAAMLGAALVAGVGLALLAARLVLPDLDPLPDIPPTPLLLVPAVLVALTAPIVAAVVAGGAWLTDRRARASDLGQVMRVAE